MIRRVLVTAGVFLGSLSLSLEAEDFSAVLRSPKPDPEQPEGSVPVNSEVLFRYSVQERASDFDRPPISTANDIREFDQRFSIHFDVPLQSGFSITQTLQTGVNQNTFPELENPSVRRPVSLTRQTTELKWSPSPLLTLSAKTGSSRVIHAGNRSATTGLSAGFGAQVTPIEGVTFSGNWLRERILGDDGSGTSAETLYAGLDAALPYIPVSLHVGGWTMHQTFDDLADAPFEMSELEAELTWQLTSALSLATGFVLDQSSDRSSLTTDSYNLYYAELSVQATRHFNFSVQFAHQEGSSQAEGDAPFRTEYSESSVRAGMKVQAGDTFFTELGLRIRNRNNFVGSYLQAPLLSLSGHLSF